MGAYNSRLLSYAEFSGRGYTRVTREIKPDLAAPGVDILTTVPGGGYGTRTGTSLAAPFVTGAAALLMEWGIVRGQDPYLYGEKVKAYLRRGARRLSGEFIQIRRPVSASCAWGTVFLCKTENIRCKGKLPGVY